MTMTLLSVGKHLSLEFDPSDLDAIQALVDAQYPGRKAAPAGIATILAFGGEEFLYQNEWDDPCLISSSTRGDEILRSMYAQLSGG
ncbi:hypothetical protein OK349_10130 [Sphingomonas sp. BT-65]|uniref:hypothetical protein n=1 Tax=Sphingomonas sp. BT-65 TaxID=2989821 RepID=UPI002236790A|nr:hypothetical protein [Sphingomonas sp. BT-65]MCW4462064.1 hypothetical protein [Sphingomonas sp. BT-65]